MLLIQECTEWFRLDDYGTDRLNYYYSTMVIMVLSVTITAKQYVGSPLQCWVPAQFTKAWEQYAENYCFVYNTYWVRPDEDVPDSVDTRVAQQLIYYQWVPFIMALEAAFFYFPMVFWSQVNNSVYLITKIIYVINLVMQFLMMNKFLGQNDPYWGVHILSDILTGTDWELSGNFPRIAMCDFQVRVLGNLQRYSIQCVLSLNMFNEKIFLFLYFWFILVGILTAFDAIHLAYSTRLNSQKLQFVRKFIKSTADEDDLMEDFCIYQVNPDMIVILNMIGAHANDVISSEVLQQMWKNYKKRREEIGHDLTFPQVKKNGDVEETRPLMFT
ncbi:unnamed protein product [Haemonchus placei]|uniref:Innexin n=1 Tax=Haemonchus placei TaxID=6290 RepID=A0A3P7XCS9_HAEPC|nr:unnamed protein product [Haemonchus placei]